MIALLVAGARINAHGSDKPVTQILKSGTPGTKELVVLVHGYKFTPGSMAGVEAAIHQAQPQADVLLFDFPAQTFADTDLFKVAWQMQEQLDGLQSIHHYERITLSGFSVGALLIRKAYVYGCGNVADAPVSEGTYQVTGPIRDWVTHVDRLVLLAGMNRGWSTEGNLPNAKLGRQLIGAFGLLLAKLSHTGLLIRQCERGEPFVANLRLQWLEVMRRQGERQVPRPTVIQLLGLDDDVVSKDDSCDVTVARDFIWVPVNNTGHADMIDLGDTGTPLERKEKVQQAFGNEEMVAKLRRASTAMVLNEDRDVKTVVFILHGIRDMGAWTSLFEQPLLDAYEKKRPDAQSKLYVHPASYGYFGMGPFLLWEDRQKNVRWFMDQVTELTARFPNMVEIDFIGHSNGTYVMASALRKYATLKVNRVVLAGSVIRRDFPWSSFPGRVGSIRNYVGASDWVVGLLPRVFELPVFNLFNPDIGSAGFNGFEDGFSKQMETQFVRGAHSAALQPENVQSIVDFIIDGKKTDPVSLHESSHPGYLAFLSNMCWLLWIMVGAIIVLGAWKAPTLGRWLLGAFWPSAVISAQAITWLSRSAYLFFLWLFLQTY